jgi:beta-glucosidase
MKFKSLSLISYYLCVCSFFLRKADAFKYVEEEETQPTFRDWDTAYELAQLLVDNMSLEQKVNITTGIGWGNGPCVGNTGRTENPDFPELCLQDSPLGIRMAENITSGVSGINAAASFDKTAIYNRGKYLANEFRNKGINALLGPTINIMRTPQGGRNWEGFGEDPFLAGVASVETINGIQSQGVVCILF